MPVYVDELVVESSSAPAADAPPGAPAPAPRLTDALMDAAEAEHRRRRRELD
jgi:hypothetical protein